MTIGGSTATQLIRKESSGVDNDVMLYGLTVTAGTTADVVVTFPSTRACCAVVSYSLYGLASTTPGATASAQNSAAIISLNANTTADSIAIGLASESLTSQTFTWAGATERFDEAVESGVLYWTSSDDIMSSAETPRTFTATVSATPSQAGVGVLVVMTGATVLYAQGIM